MASTEYTDLQGLHNPAVNTTAPSSWGDQIRTNQQHFANRAITHLDRSIALTVNHSSLSTMATQVPFNQENADTDGQHDNVTNNSRVNINQAGWYLVLANVIWSESGGAANDGDRWMSFYKTGTRHLTFREPASTQFNTVHDGSWLIDCSTTDYVELYVAHSGGSTANNLNATIEMQTIMLSQT